MKKLFIVLVLLTLSLVACEQAQEFDAPTTVDEEKDSMPSSDSDMGEQAELSPREKIESICESNPEFKAVYEVYSEFQGESSTDEQVIVVKGDNYKQAIETDAMYVVNDTVYDCRNNDGWECYYFPRPESSEEPVDTCRVPENITVESAPSRNILGSEVECFSYSMSGVDATEVNCYTGDGVLAYAKQESENVLVERTVVSVDRSVSDSEFELPAEPQEFNPEDFQNAQPR